MYCDYDDQDRTDNANIRNQPLHHMHSNINTRQLGVGLIVQQVS